MALFKVYIELTIRALDRQKIYDDVRGVLESSHPTCDGIISIKVEKVK